MNAETRNQQSSAVQEHISGKKILVIEDNPLWQTMIKRSLLKIDGHFDVQVMASAEAFHAAKNDPREFSLIVSDHYLGDGQTGLDLWREIRDDGVRTPFLLTSALEESRFSHLIENDSTSPHYIGKPFIDADFKSYVRDLMKQGAVEAAPLALAKAKDRAYSSSLQWLFTITLFLGLGMSGASFLNQNMSEATLTTVNSTPVASAPVQSAPVQSAPVQQVKAHSPRLHRAVPRTLKAESHLNQKGQGQWVSSELMLKAAAIEARADLINLEAQRNQSEKR